MGKEKVRGGKEMEAHLVEGIKVPEKVSQVLPSCTGAIRQLCGALPSIF